MARRPIGYVWLIDNTIEGYGETDTNEQIVRINVARHDMHGEPLLDTFVHEHLHIKYPRLSEKKVRELAGYIVDFLPRDTRNEMEAKYWRHLHRIDPFANLRANKQ